MSLTCKLRPGSPLLLGHPHPRYLRCPKGSQLRRGLTATAGGGRIETGISGAGGGLCLSRAASLGRERRAAILLTSPFPRPQAWVGSVVTQSSHVVAQFAGQDMVPEQTLQVQEADEARRGSSGGQRAGEWQGLVCRLPTGATRLESELLLWEGLRQQRRLLRPQLHVLVSFSAPRSYAAASTHVRLSVRSHPPPSRLPWPGPSRLQVHPPFRVPWARRRRTPR